MVLRENENTESFSFGTGRLGRWALLTYPLVLTLVAYQVLGSCYRTMQSQQAPPGYCTDKGEGLSNENREAITNAKRWIESQLMGDSVSLDARYRVRVIDGTCDVHVVFVTGYSPWGVPLFMPNGHCFVRFRNQNDVEILSPPFETKKNGAIRMQAVRPST